MNQSYIVTINGQSATVTLSEESGRLLSRMDGTPTIQDIIDDQDSLPSSNSDLSQWVSSRIFHAAADELERSYSDRNGG